MVLRRWRKPPQVSEETLRARAESRLWASRLDDIWIDGDPDPIYDYWSVREVSESSRRVVGPGGGDIPIMLFHAGFLDDERHPLGDYEVAAVAVGVDVEPTPMRRPGDHTVGAVVVAAGAGVVAAGRCTRAWHPFAELPEREHIAPLDDLVAELRRRGITVREA